MREFTLDGLDFADHVRPGDTVLFSPSMAEPTPLVAALMAQRAGLGGIRVLLGTSYSGTVQPQHADHVRFAAFGATGDARQLAKAGVLDILPIHMSQAAEMIATGAIAVDVALVQLAEDEAGNLSFGAGDLYMGPALGKARTVLAEVNRRAPWTYGRAQPDRGRITAFVRTDRPFGKVEGEAADEAERAIAGHVAALVPDGATLQVGVGGLFAALGEALGGHRDLGIHSGTVGDMVADLVETGVVTNARKPVDAGTTVTTTLLGSRRLFDFAHRNRAVRVDDATYVHAAATLRRLDRLHAINSAVEVDLTGQVNSEIAGTAYIGSIGGQVDFARAASQSPGGLSIIALRASGRKPGSSRIVAEIASGVTTTTRADIDCVVTEYGVAHLRGRTIGERVRAMIAVAPPHCREELERAALAVPGMRR